MTNKEQEQSIIDGLRAVCKHIALPPGPADHRHDVFQWFVFAALYPYAQRPDYAMFGGPEQMVRVGKLWAAVVWQSLLDIAAQHPDFTPGDCVRLFANRCWLVIATVPWTAY